MQATGQEVARPPRASAADRFLAQRGGRGAAGLSAAARVGGRPDETSVRAKAMSGTAATANWRMAGPSGVVSADYGVLGGRVSALAFDPADATGNRLFVGTTGGGVWVTQNAATASSGSVVFQPLTDTIGALSGVRGGSISIGALTVKPDGSGVILAGTGDPNDALDSYYGGGILRSTDNGASWTLIQHTADLSYSFVGEGFAGFAWSTKDPKLVVAAVSQAYEGALVNAVEPGLSCQGLYYSTDSGATWRLATITDGSGKEVQGPTQPFAMPDGNAATAVVWNPVRNLFVAAVRYHGYYQSMDGVTWTRMSAQPGSKLTTTLCPNNRGTTGSTACPIFRGALAVNPQTGDTFAWTVDGNNQDQGLWQAPCAISAGNCGNPAVSFSQRWSTTGLESSTTQGAATIANGDYNLTLAAVPAAAGAGADTLLFAGANDLWKCSLAMGCSWRNTTNFSSCKSARVAGYQHVVEWSRQNSAEIFVGNDGGLWRSLDQVGQSGSVCAATDADHFDNLNASFGSLAEVESLALPASNPYTVATGLGANGTAGVKSGTEQSGSWPQVMGGEGGPVAIDPAGGSWYVNAGAGVSVYACTQSGACTPSVFGTQPVIGQADAGNDGLTMTLPAAIAVDPVDSSRLLVGTCRLWRGRADGSGWTGSNAISGILDAGGSATNCQGNSTISAIAAVKLPDGGERIYVGMHGAGSGGGLLPGHLFGARFSSTGGLVEAWSDLTFGAVGNDGSFRFNRYSWEVSSIAIDPHDVSGKTVYVTLQGAPSGSSSASTLYGSTDGGVSWSSLISNLPWSPANGVAVDPLDEKTVYVATDAGVYSTRSIDDCAGNGSTCWSAFGTGLPWAPVAHLSAAPASASAPLLTAGTYGRGVWRIPLWTADEKPTTAALTPASQDFGSVLLGDSSTEFAIELKNAGSAALVVRQIELSGDFHQSSACEGMVLPVGATCTMQVKFTPTLSGTRTGQLSLGANLSGASPVATLSGVGVAAGNLTATPYTISFGEVARNTSSAMQQVTVQNAAASGTPAISFSYAVAAPFAIVASQSTCGTSLAPDHACSLMLVFAPTALGAASGSLSVTSVEGTRHVALSGMGVEPATDTLSASSLSFADTIVGQLSASQSVTVTNSGDVKLIVNEIKGSTGYQVSSKCSSVLPAHSSCSIDVAFSPTLAGSQPGTLTVNDELRTQTVALSGTGLTPPSIELAPSGLSFASTPVGSSATQAVTVRNAGGAALSGLGLQVSGAAVKSFTAGVGSCGSTLASGSSCAATVTFSPKDAGGLSATLTVSSSTLGVNAKTVTLFGTATNPSGLNAAPAQVSFGAVALGRTSSTQSVTVTNNGSVAAASLALSVPTQFVVVQNGCSTTLAAGASCTATLVFAPSALGAASGTLTVSSSSYSAVAMVALSGVGASSVGLTLAPSSMEFGTVAVGQASSTQTVTVSNTGAVGSVSGVQLAAPAGFQLVQNGCGGMLAAGDSCTAGVQFVPAAAGAQSGTLTVAGSTGSLGLPVSGTGYDFALSASGSSSQSVTSGSTVSYTLVVKPAGGQSGSFGFQCGTLPSYAACTFSTNPMTVAAGATGSAVLQVTTSQTASAANVAPRFGAGSMLWLCALLALPLARRRVRRLLLPVVLALALGLVESCGGSGGGISGGPTGKTSTTPAGTYSIVVTVTSGGAQQTLTLTLTVV